MSVFRAFEVLFEETQQAMLPCVDGPEADNSLMLLAG